MSKVLRVVLVCALAFVGVARGVAFADATDTNGTNVQDGDNSGSTQQNGAASSGDAVGGQVTGVVSSGDTSVDAKNRSEDVDIQTGDAIGNNTASSFVGLDSSTASADIEAADVTDSCNDVGCDNVQNGDNDFTLTQTANASSGDGVGGQVIGAVTSAGGSADIVADNSSEDVDIDTGEASADNASAAFTGLLSSDFTTVTALAADDVTTSCNDVFCNNVQAGDNDSSVDQTADTTTGDGVGGQVIGSVSAGDTSIDAKNRSEDVDIQTGDAEADNSSAAFAGLNRDNTTTAVTASDVTTACNGDLGCANVQNGDNSSDVTQGSTASSGDGVGGQVIGSVTSAGGSADIAADNSSEDVDIDTGEANAANRASTFVGEEVASVSSTTAVAAADDVDDACNAIGCNNVQAGDNDSKLDQTSDASSGDGVGGQVIGSVSAGDTSIDAKNSSNDIDIHTGDAASTNAAAAQTGLSFTGTSTEVTASDVTDSCNDIGCNNVQDGDNSTDLTQNATASTGDGVGGQVVGSVTSAGGSADIVADNSSEDVDIETGNATADNNAATFVGLSSSSLSAVASSGTGINVQDVEDSCTVVTCDNVQEGDNDLNGEQSATAATGDGVGGQVVGSVSAGDTSVDAKNRSEDVDLETGTADAFNQASVFVGLNSSTAASVVATSDVSDANALNVQDGDNSSDFSETASASSGDSVAGQVVGGVTSAGGSADAVLDNSSEDVDATSGEDTFTNVFSDFVGLQFTTESVLVG